MLSVLFILFFLFGVSAFIKIDALWGINFLFYQPTWVKFLFILPGIAVFIKPINSFLARYAEIAFLYADRIAHRLKERKFSYAAGIAAMAIAAGSLLFVFRVVPLYHDSALAIYFMKRDVSFTNYIFDTVYGKNKPLLLAFYGMVRFVSQSVFNMTPYWALTVSSIVLGLAYFLILYRLTRALLSETISRAFFMVILSTQAISIVKSFDLDWSSS